MIGQSNSCFTRVFFDRHFCCGILEASALRRYPGEAFCYQATLLTPSDSYDRIGIAVFLEPDEIDSTDCINLTYANIMLHDWTVWSCTTILLPADEQVIPGMSVLSPNVAMSRIRLSIFGCRMNLSRSQCRIKRKTSQQTRYCVSSQGLSDVVQRPKK